MKLVDVFKLGGTGLIHVCCLVFRGSTVVSFAPVFQWCCFTP